MRLHLYGVRSFTSVRLVPPEAERPRARRGSCPGDDLFRLSWRCAVRRRCRAAQREAQGEIERHQGIRSLRGYICFGRRTGPTSSTRRSTPPRQRAPGASSVRRPQPPRSTLSTSNSNSPPSSKNRSDDDEAAVTQAALPRPTPAPPH